MTSLSRFSHLAMGTFFEVVIAGSDQVYAGQAARAVFEEIDRLEGLFSRFNPGSEIGQINLLRPNQSLKVSLEVYECLTAALRIQALTQGAFRGGQVLRFAPLKLKRGFALKIRNDSAGIEGEGGAGLDLGGIGKGYALDRAASILSDWDIGQALLHGGTSTALALGDAFDKGAEGKGWPVGIGGDWPGLGKNKLWLKGRALSCSGTEVKGKHILDLRTGLPASGHLAAWASHPSAAAADALSTAFMVMSTEEVKDCCAKNPEIWALVIIDSRTSRVFNSHVFEH